MPSTANSKWITRQKYSTSPVAREFLIFFSGDDLGPPPSKMKLVLSEVAKKHPPSLGGQYLLGEGLTNNRNYWVHRSGHSAIWWNDQGWFWCVGTRASRPGSETRVPGSKVGPGPVGRTRVQNESKSGQKCPFFYHFLGQNLPIFNSFFTKRRHLFSSV